MANDRQVARPAKINLDKHPKNLAEDEARYLLNHEVRLNMHGGSSANIGKSTPMPANYPACDYDNLPAGENFRNGSLKSTTTNETYSWIYNTNGYHFIQRINNQAACEIVYDEDCLKLSADPRHSIEAGRAYLKLDEIKCKGRHGKYLVWVNGDNEEIGYLDVEASIATNSFTTPFFSICPDPCAMISMCVPKTCDCITGEFMPVDPDDEFKTNHVVDISFKFADRLVYYDERASDVSAISTLFYQDTKGCFSGSEGFPRCIKLRLPIGNPMVDRIELLYSTDNGATWLLYDTIEKYKPYTSTAQWWYERELNPELDLDPENNCYFFYNFCNDKQCEAIPSEEVLRVTNPMPRKPQAILPIKGLLGFVNYEQGACPLSLEEVKKFSITTANEADSCHPEMVTVKVRAIIQNTRIYDNDNQFIYRINGNWQDPDDKTDTAFFGGFERDSGIYPTIIINQHSQNFNGFRNFVAYIEGTDYFQEMEQWSAQVGFTNRAKVGVIAGVGEFSNRQKLMISPRFYYQEAEFKVKAGTKGFIRLQSHLESSNNSDTSTFVGGIIQDIAGYFPFGYDSATVKSTFPQKEIYFDTCFTAAGGTLELTKCFLIEDHATENQASTLYGYVRDKNGYPVENLELFDHNGAHMCWTDHNGFHHSANDHPDNNGGTENVDIRGELSGNCATPFQNIATISITTIEGADTVRDFVIDDTVSALYNSNFYAEAKVKVVDCDGNPVSGIVIAISGSKFGVTDGLGIATIRLRNWSNRGRIFTAVLMDEGSCFSEDCDGFCSPCMASWSRVTDCSYEFVSGSPKEYTSADIIINKEAVITSKAGLKKGGVYEWAIVAEGTCGKISSAYEVGSITIPKLQKDEFEGFIDIQYDAGGIVLPDWVSCLKILRSENLNPYVLQWVVDKIEHTSDGKIKITTQSLNDYNAKYGFKTNTVYKWLEGDRVEFIRNGDSTVFTIAANGLLNYQTINPVNTSTDPNTTNDPLYFNQVMIIDDGRLKDLTEGAIIEIQRSKECLSDKPTFLEICKSLEVVNGAVIEQTGTFRTFDTFLVQRSIGSKFGLVFEHRYPSDFWSSGVDTGLSDAGRPHFINRYEKEKRFGRNITFNSASQVNYFGNLVKTFDNPEHGDITGIGIRDGRIVLVISENDSSVHEAADDLVRVGADNTIRALPADAIIGDGQPKLSGVFGCQYPHIGSIFFGDGYVTWADVSRNAYVKHDYNTAIDVSLGKFKSYCTRRFQEIESNNANQVDLVNHSRFCTGINKHTGRVMLTIKSLRQSGIYNFIKPYQATNDTIIFDTDINELVSFASFTPEGYDTYDMYDGDGCAFVTYLNGKPYIHPINSVKFNEFYGVAVDRVATLSINKSLDKIKVAISTEIQDEMMWFVAEVTTDNPNFVSEIPPVRMKKQENKWVASFLGNKNGIGGLYGKAAPRGYAINVTFVRDNTLNLAYLVKDDTKRVLYDELDLIFFKFMLSEQSGFTENL